jgi:diguanylate cyclase (GGDEF)-like protein
VARYGGEEFAVILPETDLEGAMVAAERMRKEIEALKLNFENKSIALTMSFGVASVVAGEQISESEIVKRADTALYRAKNKGKNMSCAFRSKAPAKKAGSRRAKTKAGSNQAKAKAR